MDTGPDMMTATGTRPDTTRATELIMVRHGETAWNRARRIQGHIDVALSEVGRQQADAVGRCLAAEAIDVIVSSDLARARQTADAIGAACGLPVSTDARLRERAYGAFEGQQHDALQREHADAYARWLAREPGFALPGGGESLMDFQARIERVLRDLAARHVGRRVVLVTHGGVLDAARRIDGALSLAAPRTFGLPNAGVNRLHWIDGRFSVLSWADIAHLGESLDDTEPPGGSTACQSRAR